MIVQKQLADRPIGKTADRCSVTETFNLEFEASADRRFGNRLRLVIGAPSRVGLPRDDFALDAIAFNPRPAPAAMTLRRSSGEAIFPIDLAAKLVSFGNAARLNARGVSASETHSRRCRLVALSDSTL